jgi:Holliday junction resolvase RusA-like endonuclease
MIKITIPIDPIPYLRMTQAEVNMMKIPRRRVKPGALSKWDAINRYLAYKSHVWALSRMKLWSAALDLDKKIRMDCVFYVRNGKHGDPDNCWKAIADSLFENDSRVVGSFDFFFDSEHPRTEVVIEQVEEV